MSWRHQVRNMVLVVARLIGMACAWLRAQVSGTSTQLTARSDVRLRHFLPRSVPVWTRAAATAALVASSALSPASVTPNVAAQGIAGPSGSTSVVSDSCVLVPIALSVQSLTGMAAGATLPDMLNGTQPTNFG